jgi:putative acyl-CoA dehydrogenase
MPTHEVTNQAPPLPEADWYQTDQALVEACHRYGATWADSRMSALGRIAGSDDGATLCRDANRFGPVLRSHDRWGRRVDEVDFHPSYHRLMAIGQEHGVHCFSWANPGRPGAAVARAALHYLYCQLESSVACPLTMTHAAVPSLRHSPALLDAWLPKVLQEAYDPRLAPMAEKRGVTLGMAMTEKQGGSDVRANTTVAVDLPDGSARLTGHKWFCSAPMSDAFLTLAQGQGGLSCYLVPRVNPDGGRNRFFIQRLKDKLGNKANASSEVEFDDTAAAMVGAPGRGVATILEMVAQTRLDVALGAAAGMREALRYAVHHARHRSTFGARLADHALMQNVLADMAVEVEAAVALSFRLAHAVDRAQADPTAAAFARAAMPIGKYWLSKRVVQLTFEALECHGGNGYDEAWPMARLYREAPLGSIWEGSGNVQCLDLLRVMHKQPDALDAVQRELQASLGADPHLDRQIRRVHEELSVTTDLERRARRLCEALALALQGGLLVQHAPPAVAQAFIRGRLIDAGHNFGTLPSDVDLDALLARA